MKKLIVNCTLEYNNISDPNSNETDEIIQNLNLKVVQSDIKETTNADNVNIEDAKIINE
tara:strand:+ start:410 stop:586 length:177 start_codon:yes stop_codon:yes gene_type:complete